MSSQCTPTQDDSASEIELLKEQLASAQKMSMLGELVGTTTHEFNNVLMTIINYAKMGLRHPDQPTRDKAFDKILTAGLRAAKITNGILGIARNRSDDFEPTDLGQLVDDALVLLERELSKYRVRVEKDFRKVPQAIANGNQIQQVLLNLLVNARQAMPDGGRVAIKITHDQASNMVDLTIRDSGKGIPQEKLPKIFEAYYSTKKGPDSSGRGGTGIGLSTCRDIIAAHNGRIRVESSLGKGTAFTIKLPAVPKPKRASNNPQSSDSLPGEAGPGAILSVR